MTEEGRQAVAQQGFFVIDGDGDYTTPLIGDADCAYACRENGTTLCAIEKAWREGRTAFRKPVSCHLYPIRVTKFSDGSEGLHYHRWDICAPARRYGRKTGIRVYESLREPIIRKSAPNSTKSWMQRPNTWRKNIEQNETQHFRCQSDSLYRRIVDHPPFARRTAQCPETRRLASPGDRYARYGRQQYQNSDIHEQYLVLLLSRPERKNGQGGLSGTLGERPGFRLYGHPAQRAAAGYRPAAH